MGISVGIVGLGAFGKSFVDLFKAHPLVDRIAFCDIEKQRVAEFANDPFMGHKFNEKDTYYSLDGICKSDLDAIVVITQPWLHAPQCLQVLESDKDVFSAVPLFMVPDGDEVLEWCDKLVDGVKRTGRKYMLGETSFYHAESMFMRRMAAEGKFGQLIMGEGRYCHDYSGAFGCSLRKVYRDRTASLIGSEWPSILKTKYKDMGILDGPMFYPTHSMGSAFTAMNTRATKVTALGTRPSGYDSYFEDVGHAFSNEIATFHLANGAIYVAHEYRESPIESYNARLYGTCGCYFNHQWNEIDRKHNTEIEFVPEHKTLTLTDEEMRDKLPQEVQKAFLRAENKELQNVDNLDFTHRGHGGSHPYLVHEFIDAVANNRQPAINIWEAAHYMAMGVMAHKSALKDGELLDVPNWGFAPE